jgi:hypothetical protein
MGYKRAGKNTFARYLIENLSNNYKVELEEESFALPIKYFVHKSLNIDFDSIENLKDIDIDFYDYKLNIREIMKTINKCNDVVNGYFAYSLLNRLDRNKNYIITDCRFWKEYYIVSKEMMKTHKVLVIYIYSTKYSFEGDSHSSEAELKPLHNNVKNLINEIFFSKFKTANIDNFYFINIKYNDPIVDYVFINYYMDQFQSHLSKFMSYVAEDIYKELFNHERCANF